MHDNRGRTETLRSGIIADLLAPGGLESDPSQNSDQHNTLVIEQLKKQGRTLLSARGWHTRLVFWSGAVMVGLVATLFALASEQANGLLKQLVEYSPYLPLVVSPALLMLVAWLTFRFFPGAQGSGIPQTIAALEMRDDEARNWLLSLRVAFGKILLTCMGLMAGASIGREGPTVHVGAAIMHSLGRIARFPLHFLDRGLILAGSAAGIAAAFNTPLAGIVFAIEEMSRSFEERTSGTMLTAVVFAGVTAVAIEGNYTYFGSTPVELKLGSAWLAILVCGVAGGILGGLFSYSLIRLSRWVRPAQHRHPVLIAGGCGLVIAVIGLASGGTTFGTGYHEASQLVTGTNTEELSHGFPYLKLLATIASYLSGIPGGIFAPSLATGAGLGAHISPLFADTPMTAIVILAMAGYFAGVVQTPITALTIVMEMTASQTMLLPIMATAFIAYLVSRAICREPIYRALAAAFLESEVAEEPSTTRTERGRSSGGDPNPDKLV